MQHLREITPGILVATSELLLTNTTVVVGQDGGCLLIDPAVTVAELGLLATDLAERGLRPQAGFATHAHWDHVLWCQEFGDVPRFVTARAATAAERDRPAMISAVQEAAPGHDLKLFGRVRPLDPGQDAIPWDGPLARVLAHNGHAPGHGAVFLPDSSVLVAGDMCSDIEMPLLDLDSPDPVGEYRAGLGLLAGPAELVIPGHGRIGNAAALRARIAADFRYLDALKQGGDLSDSRLRVSWLRAVHKRQLLHVRG